MTKDKDVLSFLESILNHNDNTFYIGITGEAGSGKNTLADMLNVNFDTKIVAFADPIKEMLVALGIEDIDKYKTIPHPVLGKTSRFLMQRLGTEFGRKYLGEDIWIKVLKSRVKDLKFCIVSDVRYPNEADFIRDNGVLVHIKGRGGIGKEHSSEGGVVFKDGDFKIDNSFTLQHLKNYSQILIRLIERVYEEEKQDIKYC